MLRSVLVPLDGSKLSESTLPLAARIGRAAGATLHLAHVHVPYEPDHLLGHTQFQYEGVNVEEYDSQKRAEDVEYVEEVTGRLTTDGSSADGKVLDGRPVAERLSEYADEVGADLIVMSTHGFTGLNRMWLGSVADDMIRRTTRPLLLMHPPEGGAFGDLTVEVHHIMVPLDGSELAEQALGPATELAKATGAKMTLAHVVRVPQSGSPPVTWSLDDERARPVDVALTYLEEVAEGLRVEGLDVRTHASTGTVPAVELAEAAEEVGADLIALATHGYGGIKRTLLGSVADKLLRSSSLPLLVMRPPLAA